MEACKESPSTNIKALRQQKWASTSFHQVDDQGDHRDLPREEEPAKTLTKLMHGLGIEQHGKPVKKTCFSSCAQYQSRRKSYTPEELELKGTITCLKREIWRCNKCRHW